MPRTRQILRSAEGGLVVGCWDAAADRLNSEAAGILEDQASWIPD